MYTIAPRFVPKRDIPTVQALCWAGVGWAGCNASWEVAQGGSSVKLGQIELVLSSGGHVSDLQVALGQLDGAMCACNGTSAAQDNTGPCGLGGPSNGHMWRK